MNGFDRENSYLFHKNIIYEMFKIHKKTLNKSGTVIRNYRSYRNLRNYRNL